MASQKQINANRKNAEKSTGPRSAKGKARSRLNAKRDGLTGQITTLSDQDRPIFEQLKAELLADFDPQTAIERKLAHAVAWDTWRLDHLRAIEMNVYALGIEEDDEDDEGDDNPESDEDSPEARADAVPDDLDMALADARTFRAEAKRFELMSLYEQRMNRNMHRNLATLRDLQAERKRNYERDRKEEILLARFNEINELPIKASTAPSKNGFIFSNEEISTAAIRQRYLQTAAYRLDNCAANELYGGFLNGFADTFLEKAIDRKPPSAEAKAAQPKIHGVSPESIAIRRITHPDEFGLRRP